MLPEGSELVLFDMDGTLIPSYMDRPKEQPYGHVELLPGRAKRLQALVGVVEMGIVTNQGGAAFGYQTVDEVCEKVELCIRLCAVQMSMWIAVGHEKARVPELKWGGGRRKPAPTMLLEAMRFHGVGPDETVFVGDMETDREAAHWAGCSYVEAGVFFDAA